MEVQHRILPSQEEITLILDIIKLVTPVTEEGVSSPQLLQAIALAMSKFYEVRMGYTSIKEGSNPLMSAERSFINKGKPNQVSMKEIIDYMLVEKILHKYKKDREFEGHVFGLSHYSIIK